LALKWPSLPGRSRSGAPVSAGSRAVRRFTVELKQAAHIDVIDPFEPFIPIAHCEESLRGLQDDEAVDLGLYEIHGLLRSDGRGGDD
jgi:hypothetical protein